MDRRVKIIVVGDSNVGKTCLIHRFADNTFLTDTDTTIGTDFKMRTVEVDGKWVKLQLWDTAGQERYRTIIKDYYRDAQGVIFVYDITKEQSFDHILDWIQTVQEHAPHDIEQIIVGNKADADPHLRKVNSRRAESVANQFGCKFMETSAKHNTNVDEAFMLLTRRIMEKLKLGDPLKFEDSVILSDEERQRDSKCGCTIL
ncbi:ras-related protein Rab-8B-like isoform X2 [Liolophura sinensis]|uniref:ras-related protein Rab-8B-like isoform X2 n=1 Tax=Liolophura sinensis TaxID=3198878 RepID=UPI003159476B